MKFERIEAVLFDAVGTLIAPRQPVAGTYQAIGRRRGFSLSKEQIATRFRQAFARQETADAASGDWRTSEDRERRRWREIVFEVFDGAGAAEDREALFDDLWNFFAAPSNWRVFEDVEPTLASLGERGVAVKIASNFDVRLERIARELPPLGGCQHLFISSQVGFRKPGRSFFRAVEASLGIAPDRLLLVGDDRVNDVDGARACGWKTVLLDRNAQSRVKFSIGSLTDVLAML
jgi:putative hydrolase of the HAD superfamily